ncbi:hypothetical protein ISS96_03300 [Candidatus Bathyarchaeota archaeon]|nr:hypothetical protein [Candidatus Bathyarchaeota archaeon]
MYPYARIANTLTRNGFYLRRHGGDFFIRRDGRFVCFLSFQPLEGKVYVETMNWNPQASQAVMDIIRLIADSRFSLNLEFL